MINDTNYKEALKDGYVLSEISGDSCANCLTLMPILHTIVENRKDVKLFTIDAAPETKELCTFYNVEAVPTILLTYNGDLIGKVRGYQPDEILEIWVEAKIEEHKKSLQKL
ncbi:MAG: thioredoxin family protein [Erysipelotrichaceae bacterium]